MPFSPLIGISFILHLILALTDIVLSTRQKNASSEKRGKQIGRTVIPSFPSFFPETKTFIFEKITK